ncbi:MAG TPA: DUF423 domain-containing protein [Bacteriovoracaceae bacterium]|nr:DUF423 domain-containing protein [Bacteriovoracaceae bacterium]
MTLHPWARRALVLGSIFLALAVLIGAFGAHGLKSMVTAEKLVTFETGVRYHFYHGFGIVFLALLKQQFPELRVGVSFYGFLTGILLFSFNCYLYVLTGEKIFAILVPVGGVMFLLGWVMLAVSALRLR